MGVTAAKPYYLREEASEGFAQAGSPPAWRTRISKLRAIGLVLPGLLVFDALLVAGGFFAAVRLTPAAHRALQHATGEVSAPLIALFIVLDAGFLILGGMFGLYSRRSLLRPPRALSTAARALFWSGVIAVAFNFLLALDPPGDLRRILFTHAVVLAVGVLVVRPIVCRLLMRLAVVGPIPPRRVLILGNTPETVRVAAAIAGWRGSGTEVVGLADLTAISPRSGQRWPRFHVADWSEVVRLARSLAVEEVLIASPGIDRASAVELAGELVDRGIATSVVPHLTRMYIDAAPVRRENGVPVLGLGREGRDEFGLHLKRFFDVLLSSALGILLLPLMLLIAVLVKISSPGPVLYGQVRVGKDGKVFRMYKFRSMVTTNDDARHRRYVTSLLREGDAAGTDPSGRPVYKILDDSRVTAFGKLLRRMSVDELPQLYNVLRGEMSLVGPRPCLPFEYELYEVWQKRRLDVIPGMTGLWQVSGRSFISFEEMVLLDLYYVANWSFLLDLSLLWRTIPEVLYARGAR